MPNQILRLVAGADTSLEMPTLAGKAMMYPPWFARDANLQRGPLKSDPAYIDLYRSSIEINLERGGKSLR